ncbi:MAG: PA14 domain-containing protein [Phycisphaerae bacterium]
MTFLNWAMLIGLAGISLPIVIHLLNRRRAQVTAWGAMRFLLEAMASQNRRIRIEEMLLLVLRCLLVAMVVLAMARPFLPSRGNMPWSLILPPGLIGLVLLTLAAGMWAQRRPRNWLLGIGLVLLLTAAGLSISEQWLQNRRWASGTGGKDIVILIDASGSMQMQTDGKTNFARALEEARAVIDAADGQDAIAVYLAGPGARPVVALPTSDHQTIRQKLAELTAASAGAMDIHKALNRAVDVLAEGANPGKRIVLITDAQQLQWDLQDQARWDFLLDRAGRLTSRPELICRPLPVPEAYTDLAVAEIRPARKVVGTDRPVDLEVVVANHGTSPMTPQAVQLQIDQAEPQTRTLGQIMPGSQQSVRFEHHFATPGRHVIQASLVVEDELAIDDSRSRTIDVLDSVGVLIIDGAPSPWRRDSPADFLALALAPRDEDQTGPGQGNLLIRPTVVAAADLDRVEDLDNYAMVILANVARLPEEMAERIEQFVHRGGGLWIAPGQRAWLNPQAPADKVVTFYNDWRSRDGRPISPARLVRRMQSADAPAGLDLASLGHPALVKLRQSEKLDAVEVQVSSWWQLQVDSSDQAVSIGGRLDTEQPLLVQREFGAGQIILTALTTDRTDSNFPALRSFVVLAHEIVYHLAAGSVADGNVGPGGQYTIDLTRRRGSSEGVGLVGTYFKQRNFEEPAVRRVDAELNFDWGSAAPAAEIPADDFSIRWTGRLRPEVTGKHKIYLWADDGVRLWIDGRELLNRPDYSVNESVVEVDLTAGRKVDLRLDYFENRGAAGVRLSWSAKRLDKQVIGAENLYPAGSDSFEAIAAALAGLDELDVLGPDGRTYQAQILRSSQAIRLSFPDTAAAGLYRAQLPDVLARLLPASQGDSPTLPFVVHAHSLEGRIQPLSEEDLAAVAEAMEQRDMHLLWARSTDEMTASITGRIPGDEVWQWLALAALAVLLAETALARWIAAQRRTASAREVHLGGRTIDVHAFRQSLLQRLETADETQVGP